MNAQTTAIDPVGRGYKFAIKDSKGRYVSPISGVIYEVGKIPDIDATTKRRMRAHNIKSSVFMRWVFPEEGTTNYEPGMKGLTGLLYTPLDAKVSAGYWHTYIILEIRGNQVGQGEFEYRPIKLIDEITEINEVK